MANKKIVDLNPTVTLSDTMEFETTNSGVASTRTSVSQVTDKILGEGIDGIEYSNATPMPEDVGGFESGTTFTDQTLQQMFDGLLYPYQYPAFSSFVISGQSTSIEVGTQISGLKNFTWGTTNSSNIQTNSIDIIDYTASNTLFTGLANDGSEQYDFTPPIVKNTADMNRWIIEATNTKSQLFADSFTVNWYWRIYWGTSPNTSLTEAQIEALANNRLDTNVPGTYSFAAGDYKYFAWPSSFVQPTSFKDSSTNLDVPMESPDTVSVTNVNGIATDYKVYRTTNIIGSSIDIIVAV